MIQKALPTLLTVLLVTLPALAQKLSSEYWNDTGVTFDLVRRLGYLENGACNKNDAAFTGCVAMINSLGTSQKKHRFQLIPNILVGKPNQPTGTVVKVFETLSLLEIGEVTQESKLSSRELYLLESSRVQARKTALAQIRKTKVISFKAIVDYLIPLLKINPYEEGLIAGGMINSFIAETADTHTYLTPTAELTQSFSSGDDKFFGIGVELIVTKGKLTVVNPLPDLPGEKAGLKPGDVIAKIDGEQTDGLTLNTAVSKIKSSRPDPVILTVIRNSLELPEITVQRASVTVANVFGKTFEVDGQKVGYIRIRGFADSKTCEHVKRQLTQLSKDKVDSWVLDVRGNPGGQVDVTVCVVGLFDGRKLVLNQRDPTTGMIVKSNVSTQDQVTNLPMTVLISGTSASASEIFSGALQDSNRAWIVGERSFGKGTVQTVFPWGSDPKESQKNQLILADFGFKVSKAMTTARFHLPSGRTNQIYGITPDFEVPFKVGATEEERFVMREAEQGHKIYSKLGDPWKSNRPEETCTIQKCVANAKVSEKVPGERLGLDDMMNDYQFRTSVEVLRCSKIKDTLPKCGSGSLLNN